MRKLRVFKLGRKLVKIFKWVCTPKNRRPTGYIRLNHPSSDDGQKKTKKSFSFWVNCLKKGFWFNSAGESRKLSGLSSIYHVDQKPFKRLDRRNDCDGFKGVPKGYLAVYVGQKDEQHRFLIPVIYFNHPLFGNLLREAEEVYGYQQSGGITIPCEVSDFKSVQMKIAGEKQVKPVRRMP